MTTMIDRDKLVEYMDRVASHMEADMIAAGNGAYIRGYRAAIKDVLAAQEVGTREK